MNGNVGKFCLTARSHLGRNYLEKMGSVCEEGGDEKEFAQWTKHREQAQAFATVKQAEAMKRILLDRYAVEAEIVPRGECSGINRHGIPMDKRERSPEPV